MFVPRQLSLLLERCLPRSCIRALHQFYNPFFHWAVGRTTRRLLPQIFPESSLIIPAGPFEGMKYLPLTSTGSSLIPKLLGTYEVELHPALNQILSRRYQTIVDIGCADGYYLVGLALKIPGVVAHGFDMDSEALNICKRLAELNGVDARIRLYGRCTTDGLIPLVREKTLVFCDCEGAEVDLLDPERVPNMLQADVLVELHDRLVRGASVLIRERFSETHDVTVIRSTQRTPENYSQLNRLNAKDKRFALDEFRGGPAEWAFLSARAGK